MSRRLLYWLLLTLVVGNALVYFWPTPATTVAEQRPVRQVPRLVLVSELEPASQAAAVDVMTVAGSGQAEAPQIDAGANGIDASDTVATASINALPGAEITDSPVLSVADLQPIEITTEYLVAPAPVPAELVPLSCWYVGPVDQASAQERLVAALAEQGLQLNLVLRRMEADPDYWVHLPTAEASPRQLSRELRERGVDNFPIPEGELAGDLSLGLFRSQQRAQAVQDRVRGMGYLAEIFERPRSREEAWAALDSRELVNLGWPLESGPIAIHPSLQLQPRDCAAP